MATWLPSVPPGQRHDSEPPEEARFLGRLEIDPQASALSLQVAAAVQNGVLRIEHREPTISMHLRIMFDGKPFEARFERMAVM